MSQKNLQSQSTSATQPPSPPFNPLGPQEIVFGPDPMFVRCPQCSQAVQSKTEFINGKATWLTSIYFWVLGGICCCWCPFCCECAKDVKHSCPQCNCEFGFYRRYQ